jgi:prophage maintenance system killer protein
MAHSPTREPQGPATLRYLTVQDMLWINLQVTKKVNSFDFAKLEESVFYQYSYGSSQDVLKQACQFARGLQRLMPFDAGNEATAFLGWAAFLAINKVRLIIDDAGAVDVFMTITKGANLEQNPPDGSPHEDPPSDIEATVEELLARYPATIASLAAKS